MSPSRFRDFKHLSLTNDQAHRRQWSIAELGSVERLIRHRPIHAPARLAQTGNAHTRPERLNPDTVGETMRLTQLVRIETHDDTHATTDNGTSGHDGSESNIQE